MWSISAYLITYQSYGDESRWEIHTFVDGSISAWNRLGIDHFVQYASCYVPDTTLRGIIFDELKERGLIPH